MKINMVKFNEIANDNTKHDWYKSIVYDALTHAIAVASPNIQMLGILADAGIIDKDSIPSQYTTDTSTTEPISVDFTLINKEVDELRDFMYKFISSITLSPVNDNSGILTTLKSDFDEILAKIKAHNTKNIFTTLVDADRMKEMYGDIALNTEEKSIMINAICSVLKMDANNVIKYQDAQIKHLYEQIKDLDNDKK